MNTRLCALLWVFSLYFAGSTLYASSVTVTGAGSTFIINKNGGFTGTDGTNRETIFVAAVQVWADILSSTVAIVVDAEFSSTLFCDANSATLGSAGPYNYYFSSGASSLNLQDNIWYPAALINAVSGSDVATSVADISATFNADLGAADCLNGSGWYYGTDGNAPTGYIDFYEVVLHELGHGLGILSLINSDGSDNSGVIDIYTTFLRDVSTAKDWSAMTTTERASAVVNNGNQVWTGASVSALAGNLSAGVNSSYVQMYAPSSYESGSSISHFDTALTPDELMEPQYTGGASYDHSIALLQDIGWSLANTAPVINGQVALTTDEDTSLTLSLSDFSVTDADNSYPTDFTLTVSSGTNYSVSGTSITPAQDFYGDLTVPVTVNDGTSNSQIFNATVTVNSVNDQPVVNAQTTLSIAEDSSLTLNVADFTVTDPDSAAFTLVVASGSNYTLAGNTLTPAANFNGTLTVPITVSDGALTSATFQASVTVSAVNDPPVIVSLPTIALNEDESVTLSTGLLGITDVDSASFSLHILAGSNYSVVGNTLYPDNNYFGTLNVDLYVNDGSADSATRTLTVPVAAVNDAPVLSGSAASSVVANSSYSASFNATDVENDALTFAVTSAHSWLSMDSAGLLSGTPGASDVATETVTVSVSDGALSATHTYSLAVTAATAADLSVNLDSNVAIAALNEGVSVAVTLSNGGPALTVSGDIVVDISGSAQFSNLDSRCTLNSTTQVQCSFTGLSSATTYALDFVSSAAQISLVSATVSGSQADPNSANDSATLAIVTAAVAGLDFALKGQAAADTQALELTDVDGDGRQDLVLANSLGFAEALFDLTASFDSMLLSHSFATDANSKDVLAIDLDKNGEQDLVFANQGANHIYFNNSGFGQPLSLGSNNSTAVVATDLNGDTYPDLIFANEGPNQLYLNDQSGGFFASQQFGTAQSSAIAVIDYNADGWTDVVIANADADDYVYLNRGADQSSGVFDTTAVILGSHLTATRGLLVADLDGDLVSDDILVIRANHATAPTMEWYEISNSIASSVQSFDLGALQALAVGDVNGDAAVDIAVLNEQDVLLLYLQQGNTFVFDNAVQVDGAAAIALGDVNSDGLADIGLAGTAGESTRLYVSGVSATPAAANPVTPEPSPEQPDTQGGAPAAQEPESLAVKGGSLTGLMVLLALLLVVYRQRGVS